MKNIFCLSLLITFSGICFSSQAYKSVTVDEFSHFPAGIYNLITFDWRMDWESPPLIKVLPGVTSVITKPSIAIEPFKSNPNAWGFGYDFMYRNQNNYIDIFTWGRSVIILLAAFGGWLLFRFAQELYGNEGALFSLFLYVFNPNIIAHSRLTTIDAGAMVIFLSAIYFFWRFLKKKTFANSLIFGFFLGLAQLSKFTALILYPIFVMIFLIVLIADYLRNRKHLLKHNRFFFDEAGLFLLSFFISIVIINIGYPFSERFFHLSDYPIQSQLLKNLSISPVDLVPIPLPLEYVLGFDVQLHISSGVSPFYMGYLMGEYDMEGWWYYYFVALWVKNPEILWIVFFLCAMCWILKSPDFEAALCIWIAMIVFVFYFSFFTRIPIGVRFLMPVFPLFFLAAGYLPVYLKRYRWKKLFIAIIGVLYAIPAIAVFPNYLSYFNITSGGPDRGHRWLIDSNLDWGQDLVALKAYMEENDIEEIKLGYFGRVDPRIYGIDYQLAPKEPEKGITAISINFLMGRPYYLLEEGGRDLQLIGFHHYEKYRKLVPDRIIGNTIYIFQNQ